MSDKVSWSLGIGSANGSLSDSGSLEAPGITTAVATIGAGSSEDLTLQLGAVDELLFLAMKSSNYEGDVKIQASAPADADEIKLTGPMLLFGESVGLLGTSLHKLKVTNGHATDDVDVELVIGLNLIT